MGPPPFRGQILTTLPALKARRNLARGEALGGGKGTPMPQSIANVFIHIIFSTKNRVPWIYEDIDPGLYTYIGGVCRDRGCPSIAIGGAADHVHVLCGLSRIISISKLLERIKSGSSKWMKTNGDGFSEFSWQKGYGVFSGLEVFYCFFQLGGSVYNWEF